MKLQDDLVEHKCLCFNKNYQRKFDEKLKQQFLNTYKYSNHISISLFYCYFVYPYEYVDNWDKVNETPKKKIFTVT